MSDVVSARDGYRLWAARYEAETAVSLLEDRLVATLSPPVAGARLLDAACGTARRLRTADGAAFRVGVDLVPEMLAAGRLAAGLGCVPGGEPVAAGAGPRSPALAAADLRALPLPAASFDLVWCRLALGHLPDPAGAYSELGRVCRPGGAVVITDFHPAAARAGHRRTFRDAEGRLRELEHFVHDGTDHVTAALSARLDLVYAREAPVGREIRAFYARAGRLDLYDSQRDVPLVLALLFQRARP